MARRGSVIIIATFCLAGVAALLYLGFSQYNASPTSYGRILTQYLKALSAGDEDAASALTAGGFVNELADLRLPPGSFRAYSFGFQGSAAKDTATLRFLVTGMDGEGEAAYFADAVFARKGLRTVLTAVRLVSKGRSLID